MTAAKDSRAPFERVADELRAAITSGTLAPGDRLPSGRELAEQQGVAFATAQSALKRLRDEGLAVSTPRGYFVTSAQREPTDGDLRRELEQTRAELRALTERVERLERASER